MSRKASTYGLPQAAFAAVMGVDPSQVTRWKQRGLPMLPDGQVDAVKGAAWVRACVDNYKVRGSVGAQEMSDAHRIRLRKTLLIAYTVGDEQGAITVAELLLPLLPEATVRAVVAEFLRRSREGSASCMGEEYKPPAGCASWADAPEWNTIVPTEDDWREMLRQHAAGELLALGEDA